MSWFHNTKKTWEQKGMSWYKKILIFIFGVLCCFGVFAAGKYAIIYIQASLGVISESTISTVSKNIGKEMQKDMYGNVNILLLWYWWGSHDWTYLTDSMMIASRNPEKGSISFLSIPRDLFVENPVTSNRSRINLVFWSAYSQSENIDEATKTIATLLAEITWLDIPYYATIDFSWFKEVVDTLWGITVDVPERIYDTTYPNEQNRGYTTFYIEKWEQILDGDTALKYARSRHSTSDFSRSQRQQLIIEAVMKKLLSMQDIMHVNTIKSLYEDYTKMVETNVSNTEIIGMLQHIFTIKDMFNFGYTNICSHTSYVWSKAWCFLYVPNRDAFGGASILLPAWATYNDIWFYDYTKTFAQFISANHRFLKEDPNIVVLNGIDMNYAQSLGFGRRWFANELSTKLGKYGFSIDTIDNADFTTSWNTVILLGTWDYNGTLEALWEFITINEVLTGAIQTGVDMKVIIGNDYLSGYSLPFNTYK